MKEIVEIDEATLNELNRIASDAGKDLHEVVNEALVRLAAEILKNRKTIAA